MPGRVFNAQNREFFRVSEGQNREFFRDLYPKFVPRARSRLYRAREEANATYICRNPLKDCQMPQAYATDGSNPS